MPTRTPVSGFDDGNEVPRPEDHQHGGNHRRVGGDDRHRGVRTRAYEVVRDRRQALVHFRKLILQFSLSPPSRGLRQWLFGGDDRGQEQA